jgi:threonine dehydratase
VATQSSGNHAAALARAAQLRGIPAHIVMPINAPKSKVHNVGSFGGWISFCEANLATREAACAKIIAEKGATLVHPFDDYLVMAGAGTAAIEMLEDEPDLDAILCPVGGGGLLCGTAVAARHLKPSLKVYGVEPALADDVAQSLRAGRRISIPSPATIADGLRTNCTGEKNFPIIQELVAGILTVSEDAIRTAMRRLKDILHLDVEPSAAVTYAAILEDKLPSTFRRVGLILTGGNVDRGEHG